MASEVRWPCDSDEAVVHAEVHEDSMNVSYPDFAATGQVHIHWELDASMNDWWLRKRELSREAI